MSGPIVFPDSQPTEDELHAEVLQRMKWKLQKRRQRARIAARRKQGTF